MGGILDLGGRLDHHDDVVISHRPNFHLFMDSMPLA